METIEKLKVEGAIRDALILGGSVKIFFESLLGVLSTTKAHMQKVSGEYNRELEVAIAGVEMLLANLDPEVKNLSFIVGKKPEYVTQEEFQQLRDMIDEWKSQYVVVTGGFEEEC